VEGAEFELAGKMGTEKGMENEAFYKMGGGGSILQKSIIFSFIFEHIFEFQMKNEIKNECKNE
jgi:hypothetical protein